MLKTSKLIAIFAIISFSVISCKKDSLTDNLVNTASDSADISTVEVHLIETGTTNEMVYTWQSSRDNNSITPTIILEHGRSYNATVSMFSKTKNTIAAIPENRVHFEPSATSSLAVVDLNTDAKGVPVRLTSRWVTEVKGAGNIKIIVKDDKNKSSNTEILFNTVIK